jgi:hypothetical protein
LSATKVIAGKMKSNFNIYGNFLSILMVVTPYLVHGYLIRDPIERYSTLRAPDIALLWGLISFGFAILLSRRFCIFISADKERWMQTRVTGLAMLVVGLLMLTLAMLLR